MPTVIPDKKETFFDCFIQVDFPCLCEKRTAPPYHRIRLLPQKALALVTRPQPHYETHWL